jgi:hypothetical protein
MYAAREHHLFGAKPISDDTDERLCQSESQKPERDREAKHLAPDTERVGDGKLEQPIGLADSHADTDDGAGAYQDDQGAFFGHAKWSLVKRDAAPTAMVAPDLA